MAKPWPIATEENSPIDGEEKGQHEDQAKTNPNKALTARGRLSCQCPAVSTAADTEDTAHSPDTTEGDANHLQGSIFPPAHMS